MLSAGRVSDVDGALLASQLPRLRVTIENADKMEAAYIRTRHNNLRCFPECGKVHKTKSFCGTPLFVRIARLDPSQSGPTPKDVHVFGEFRNARKAPAFSILSQCAPKQSEQAGLIPGHLSSGPDDTLHFTINPPRKWRYRARIAQVLDMHVFTVYVVVREIVVAVHDSPPFQVIPIWKADESMLKPGEDEEEGASAGEESDYADNAHSASKRGGKSAIPQQETASNKRLDRYNSAPVVPENGKVLLPGPANDLQRMSSLGSAVASSLNSMMLSAAVHQQQQQQQRETAALSAAAMLMNGNNSLPSIQSSIEALSRMNTAAQMFQQQQQTNPQQHLLNSALASLGFSGGSVPPSQYIPPSGSPTHHHHLQASPSAWATTPNSNMFNPFMLGGNAAADQSVVLSTLLNSAHQNHRSSINLGSSSNIPNSPRMLHDPLLGGFMSGKVPQSATPGILGGPFGMVPGTNPWGQSLDGGGLHGLRQPLVSASTAALEAESLATLMKAGSGASSPSLSRHAAAAKDRHED